MLTMERTRPVAEPPDIGYVDYPQEVIDRLRKESEIHRHQIAIGEIEPITIEELAAELGIDLDG